MSLFEKARRGVGSLSAKMGITHTKEINNAINEATDVWKQYQSLSKQSLEAARYLVKWGVAAEHAELQAAFALSQTQAEAAKDAFAVLCDVLHNDYLKALTDIQKATEAAAKQEAAVEALEKKVKSGKAQQGELDAAQQAHQAELARVRTETDANYRRAATALAKAFVAFHENQAEAHRKVLHGLQAASAAPAAHAPVQQLQPAPVQQNVAPQPHFAAQPQQPQQLQQQPPSAPVPDDDDDDVLPPGPVGMVGQPQQAVADDEAPPPYSGP